MSRHINAKAALPTILGVSVATLLILWSALALANQGGRERLERAAFDTLVREDFFAGFAGDSEALERDMKKCDEELARNPKNAEALV